MAFKVEPAVFVYECDCCGDTVRLASKQDRPSGWAKLCMQQDAEDYQGQAVADASFSMLLCRRCRLPLMSFGLLRNALLFALRTPSPDTETGQP